ncbi:glycosyltransferase family 1 protein [Geobacillus thermoleovorans]|uniref:Glycosyltransferase family 1 protein n=1 Tax=Geobacillus thermoleovorans TaxID=33941 RepID=A0A2Z3N781_GEOTH|nr:glycosyltransferase [Geobacillus thermoleovorans]AWO74740.1 glycosyltransferase family 1 protein [Geobacillus thermoleovorans]
MSDQNKTIVLYNGQSQYGVLRYFIQDLAASFQRLGFEVKIIDLLASSWIAELERVLREKEVFFFLSMNAMGIDIKVGDKSLYNHLNIPLFAFLVDHPMYHINRLNQGVKNLIVSTVDQAHLSFLRTFLNGVYSKVFIPHGSSYHEVSVSSKTIEERKIDILFVGTFTNPDHFRKQWTDCDKYIGKLFDAIMEKYLYTHNQTLIDIAESVFVDYGIDQEYMHHVNFWSHLVNVDLYIRNRRRMEAVLETAKLDARFEVYGNGWETLFTNHHSIKLNRAIGFGDVYEKMRDSKLVLNVLPNFVHGGHERIFTTMLNGSVSLTDNNLFLESEFKDGEDLLLYSFAPYPHARIQSFLDDKVTLQKIAENGRKKVMEKHTWLARAEKIVETVMYHKHFMA